MYGWILWTGMTILVIAALTALTFFRVLAYWCYKFLKEGDGRG